MAVSADRVIKGLKRFLFELKRDRQAREALLLVVALLGSALLLWMVGQRFLLAGLQRQRASLRLDCDRLRRELSQPLPVADISRLERERKRLRHSLELLETKRFFLSLDHAARTDPVRFQRVVLGFVSGAPFSLKTSLVKSSFSGGGAAVDGRLPFVDLIQYLDYLEHELAVAYMDDLSVKAGKCGGSEGEEGLLCFSLTLASSPPGADKAKKGGNR